MSNKQNNYMGIIDSQEKFDQVIKTIQPNQIYLITSPINYDGLNIGPNEGYPNPYVCCKTTNSDGTPKISITTNLSNVFVPIIDDKGAVKNSPCKDCHHNGICKYEDRMLIAIGSINNAATEYEFIDTLNIGCKYKKPVTILNGSPVRYEPNSTTALYNNHPANAIDNNTSKNISTTNSVPVMGSSGEALSIKTTTTMRSGSNRSADIPTPIQELVNTETGTVLPTSNIPIEGINPDDIPPQFRDTIVNDLTTRLDDPEQTSNV